MFPLKLFSFELFAFEQERFIYSLRNIYAAVLEDRIIGSPRKNELSFVYLRSDEIPVEDTRLPVNLVNSSHVFPCPFPHSSLHTSPSFYELNRSAM